MKKRILVALFSLFFVTSCTLPVGLVATVPATATPSVTPSPTITPTATPTPIPLPSDHTRNGDTALFNGDYNTALDEYKLALNQTSDPSVIPTALFGIGRVYAAEQDCVDAMDAFNQLVSQYSSSPMAAPTYYYAAQCFEASGNYAQAAADYDVFLSIKPGIIDDTILVFKGDALVNAGNYAGAISAYTASLAANPPANMDAVQLKIGQAYAAEGDQANAIKTFLDLYNNTLSDYTKATCDLPKSRRCCNECRIYYGDS